MEGGRTGTKEERGKRETGEDSLQMVTPIKESTDVLVLPSSFSYLCCVHLFSPINSSSCCSFISLFNLLSALPSPSPFPHIPTPHSHPADLTLTLPRPVDTSSRPDCSWEPVSWKYTHAHTHTHWESTETESHLNKRLYCTTAHLEIHTPYSAWKEFTRVQGCTLS